MLILAAQKANFHNDWLSRCACREVFGLMDNYSSSQQINPVRFSIEAIASYTDGLKRDRSYR